MESSIVSLIYETLVTKGNFKETERILEENQIKLFDSFLREKRKFSFQISFNLINNNNSTPINEEDSMKKPKTFRPIGRGGHQMVIDSNDQKIYLFGGWNGFKDLNDFWSFNLLTNEWTLISQDSQLEGGPSPRSCHKLTIDVQRKKIFSLGKYLDSNLRKTFVGDHHPTANQNQDHLKSDFFVFDILSNEWTLITEDTEGMGGPKLVFDHQICFDSKENILWIFGGKVIQPISDQIHSIQTSIISGLYSFQVPTNSWKCLRKDFHCSSSNTMVLEHKNEYKDVLSLPRVGHSMIFNGKNRTLLIFGGERTSLQNSTTTRSSLEYCPFDSIICYSIDNDVTSIISLYNNDMIRTSSSFCSFSGLRSSFDEENEEIFIFSSNSSKCFFFVLQLTRIDPTNQDQPLDHPPPPPHHHQQPINNSNKQQHNHNQHEIDENSFFSFDLKKNSFSFLFKISNQSNQSSSSSNQNSASSSSFSTINPILIKNQKVFKEGEKEEEDPLSDFDLSTTNQNAFNKNQQEWPQARYAHQFLYDPINKIHFLFGGNPGIGLIMTSSSLATSSSTNQQSTTTTVSKSSKMNSNRLNDFWSFKVRSY